MNLLKRMIHVEKNTFFPVIKLLKCPWKFSFIHKPWNSSFIHKPQYEKELKPAFSFQDIEVEIPVQFQRTVTLVYYVFLSYVLALAVNVIASFFYVVFGSGPISILVLAVIQILLLSSCSFLFWFRPVYKAFRFVVLFSLCFEILTEIKLEIRKHSFFNKSKISGTGNFVLKHLFIILCCNCIF